MTRKMLLLTLMSMLCGVPKIWSMEEKESWGAGVGATLSFLGHITMKRVDSNYRINNATQNSTFTFNQTICTHATTRTALDICNDITLIDTKAFPLCRRLADACEEILLAAKRRDFQTITKIHQKTKGMKPPAIELICENFCNHADESTAQQLNRLRKVTKPATSFVAPDHRTDTLEDYRKKEQELAESADYVNKLTIAAGQLDEFMKSSKNYLSNLRYEGGTSQKRILAEVDSQLEEVMATAAALRATIGLDSLPQIGRRDIFLPAGDTGSIYSVGDEHWPSESSSTCPVVYDLSTPHVSPTIRRNVTSSAPILTAENLQRFTESNPMHSGRPYAPSMVGKIPHPPRTVTGTEIHRRSSVPHINHFSSDRSDKTSKSASQHVEMDEETMEKFKAFLKQQGVTEIEDESEKVVQTTQDKKNESDESDELITVSYSM